MDPVTAAIAVSAVAWGVAAFYIVKAAQPANGNVPAAAPVAAARPEASKPAAAGRPPDPGGNKAPWRRALGGFWSMAMCSAVRERRGTTPAAAGPAAADAATQPKADGKSDPSEAEKPPRSPWRRRDVGGVGGMQWYAQSSVWPGNQR